MKVSLFYLPGIGNRAQVEAAIDEAFQRLGPSGFKTSDIGSQFVSDDVSLPTLYRWIK